MLFNKLRTYHPTRSRVALVTGGTGVLGQAIVEMLAENGWQVIFQYFRNEQKAFHILDVLKGRGLTAQAVQSDIDGDIKKLKTLLAEVERRAGAANVFIHCCAPEFELSKFDENWIGVFQNMITLNVDAFLKLSQLCLPAMTYSQDGAIVGILSESVIPSSRILQFSAYAAAKMALASLLKDLSLSAQATGVRILGVLPGAFKAQSEKTSQRPWPAEVKEALGANWPIGVDPQKVAQLILKILRQKQEYPNGSFVAINATEGERDVSPFGFFQKPTSETVPSEKAVVASTPAQPRTGATDSFQQKLEVIFRRVLGMGENEPVSDARLGGGRWDSLHHLDLLMSVEHEMGVRFIEVEGESLTTFSNILRFMEEQKK